MPIEASGGDIRVAEGQMKEVMKYVKELEAKVEALEAHVRRMCEASLEGLQAEQDSDARGDNPYGQGDGPDIRQNQLALMWVSGAGLGELEKAQTRIEELEAENDVLSLSLGEGIARVLELSRELAIAERALVEMVYLTVGAHVDNENLEIYIENAKARAAARREGEEEKWMTGSMWPPR